MNNEKTPADKQGEENYIEELHSIGQIYKRTNGGNLVAVSDFCSDVVYYREAGADEETAIHIQGFRKAYERQVEIENLFNAITPDYEASEQKVIELQEQILNLLSVIQTNHAKEDDRLERFTMAAMCALIKSCVSNDFANGVKMPSYDYMAKGSVEIARATIAELDKETK